MAGKRAAEEGTEMPRSDWEEGDRWQVGCLEVTGKMAAEEGR